MNEAINKISVNNKITAKLSYTEFDRNIPCIGSFLFSKLF